MTVGLGAAVWPVYFAALIALYLTAYHRKVMPCQAAAGWGLAIAFAAALLFVPIAVNWPSAARRASRPAPRVLAWLIGPLLALGSVAVIWVAVNLTIASDTAGAWMLTVCAAIAPPAVLLTLLFPSPGAGIAEDDAVADDAAVAPPVVSATMPETAVVADVAADVIVSDVKTTPETAGEVVVAEAAVSEALAPELAPPGLAPPDVAPPGASPATDAPAGAADVADYPVADAPLVADAAVAEMEALVLGDKTTITGHPFLAADWEARLGSKPPRVAVDKGMWDVVLGTLGQRHLEVGGVALTVPVADTIVVLGLVLPQQVQVSGVFCEFRAEEVSRVRDVIDAMSDIFSFDSELVKITWVHTHPGMGPFLSGTDRATTATWRAFDSEFTPIVLDPLAKRIDQQIGVFDIDNRKIEHLRVIEGLADEHVVGLLKSELIDAYRDARGTMVLFGTD